MSIPINPIKGQPTITALQQRLREFLYLNLITRPYKSGILRPLIDRSTPPSAIFAHIAAIDSLSTREKELMGKIQRNLGELERLEDGFVRAGCGYLRNVVLLCAELLEGDAGGVGEQEVYWLRRNVVEFMEIVVASREAAGIGGGVAVEGEGGLTSEQ